MRPQSANGAAATGISADGTILLDWMTNPFTVGVAINLNGGTLTTKLQYCLENPANYATIALYNASALWLDAAAPFASVAANTGGVLSIPCAAIRLNNTAWTSGTPSLNIVQYGGGIG